jgi:hypothetical protein
MIYHKVDAQNPLGEFTMAVWGNIRKSYEVSKPTNITGKPHFVQCEAPKRDVNVGYTDSPQ